MSETVADPSQPRGIGGWLILPLIGLLVSPVVGLWNFSQALPAFNAAGDVPAGVMAFLTLETLGALLLQVVATLYLIIQMLGRRRAFPRQYQAWLIANLAFWVLDLVIGYVTFRDLFEAGQLSFFDNDAMRAVISSAIPAAIWVPYMERSVRVRNTFVQ